MEIAILSGNDEDALGENARLADELDLLGCTSTVVDYQTTTILESDSLEGITVLTEGASYRVSPDAVIVRINEPDSESTAKAKRFMEAFRNNGIPLTVSPTAVDVCKDKILTHDKLIAAGVPTPRTAKPTNIRAADILQLLEYVEPNENRPIVIKKLFGTKGIGVARAGTRKSALPFIQMLVDSDVPILAQQYIATKRNGLYRDKRLYVIGGVVVAAMLRESSNDFRTNLSLGDEEIGGISDARGSKLRVSKQDTELALRASEALGVDTAGIDILPSRGGGLVDDVNISAGFRIENITSTNIAGAIAHHALSLAQSG